jgi:hypothetical protein
MESYSDKILSQLPELINILQKKGIKNEYLNFDEVEILSEKIRIPTDAKSEFLANRAMGDWAENLLINQINKDNNFVSIRYGNDDVISAGEKGFAEFYIKQKKQVIDYGKRPDILIFEKNFDKNINLTNLDIIDAKQFVDKSLASIEVRSSKFDSDVYKQVRKQDREEDKNVQETLGFSLKVEDIKIVYRWIKLNNKSQSYFQVFFDKIYAMNFLEMIRYVASNEKKIKIKTPEKSQGKTTIFIPLDLGTCVGTIIEKPKIEAIQKITRLGRYDFYVKPVGGKLELNYENFNKIVFI